MALLVAKVTIDTDWLKVHNGNIYDIIYDHVSLYACLSRLHKKFCHLSECLAIVILGWRGQTLLRRANSV